MPSKYQLAYMVWPYLVEAAEARRTITYGNLASKIGYQMAIVMRHALDPLYYLCPDKGWPNITGIVVNAETGRPGPGFEAWRPDELEKKWEEVFEHPWRDHPRPFPPQDLELLEPGAAQLIDYSVPDRKVEVNGRGPYQEALRRDLLSIYGRCCALCETRHPSLLVASHIVPWAQDVENRRNPRNAILFCRTHDALFEHGLLAVRPDYSVEPRPASTDILGREVARFLAESTAEELRISESSWSPDPSFLEWRLANCNDKHEKGS